ncbi:MAG: regulatory protein RecX [Flavipsychrobacter sp.]
MRNKLYELGCTTPEVEENIAELIEAGLLNEEQFARAYARGKFRMKQWGRQKIVSQLRFKKVSEYCIRKGLSEIDADEYEQTLTRLGTNKWNELKGERSVKMRQMKVFRYLMQKGYESDLARDLLNTLIRK